MLSVSADAALAPDNQRRRRYIVCGAGHFVGLDVHDRANSSAAACHDGTLEPDMTLAVEPGLYFHPNDLTVPPELRGIGVRIEDNVLVTGEGIDILSAELSTDPDALQRRVLARQPGVG